MFETVSNFKRIYGQNPDLSASAPGRVNLIGEHIDYSDGFVLPFAIKDRSYVSMRRRTDRIVRVASAQRESAIVEISLDDLEPGSRGDWERYPLGAIWAFGLDVGVDLFIDSRVPLGAGLSSSAALECSVAFALNQLFSRGYDLSELARLAQRAENDFVGMPCGIMDQSVSLMAQEGHALLLDCRDLSRRQVPLDLASSDLELLIIDTQAHHALVDGGYAERRSSCESVAIKLKVNAMRDLSMEDLNSSRGDITNTEYIRARHAVTEIERVLKSVKAIESRDFEQLGRLLNESHISLRDDYDVSCPELNVAVEAALEAGALGARMTGGGFGGSAAALISELERERTITKIQEAFAAEGFKVPRFFTSRPSGGAALAAS